ncbi:MAG: helicase-exonuclease AddAB subunit AddA [Clostridia bacterium]|nr:helicase-exonuclease AddAB subunit AddA [Clostridia bacterium]
MRQLDTKWTPAQRGVIRSRGETLLVSAAAGSGKTAVLTERIIDRLLDEENALDLSSVLVVTFTKAAAAELKSRIRAALDREIAKNPDNRRLQTQLLSVGRAKICTIDSFCFDLIRMHFDVLGISPRVSVSDEAQARLLNKNVMNALIDDCFDKNDTDGGSESSSEGGVSIADFGAFTDLFVTSRNADQLADVLLNVRETINGYEKGIAFLTEQSDALKAAAQTDFFFACDAGRPIYEELLRFVQGWCREYDDLCTLLSLDPVYQKNYGDCFSYEKTWCETLCTILSNGEHCAWDDVRKHFESFSSPSLKSGIRGDKKTEEILRAKTQHERFNEQRKAFAESYFTVTEEQLRTLNAKEAQVNGDLAVFLEEFERRLWNEKKQRQTLDFGDMGRLAMKLLWDFEEDTPTELARQEAAQYTEIYIDEYQDVSPVQDRIFTALAREDNRFMVGDAKQSIYGFRGATPQLFLAYRADFAAQKKPGRTIFLSDNFRCDRQIIDFSNLIFSVLFGHGSIPYAADDALRCAKVQEGDAGPKQKKVSLAVIPSKTDDVDEDDGVWDTSDASSQDSDASEGAGEAYTEADYIADTVSYLLSGEKKNDGSPIRPRDITILVRSTKTSALPIAKALEKRKIPTYNSAQNNFFENAEVLLMYSLLSVIDNPARDVDLAGTLKSPLFRVTLDELIYMRRQYPHGSLYDALCAFTKETGYAKGQYFLEKLTHYRRRAEGMPVDRFLWYLYQDTGILSLVYEREKHVLFEDAADCAQMRANLMMFYEYARSFARGSFQGLYQFVAFISNIIEEKQQMPPVLLSGEDADAVRIMTVHQSKGLEFPVCILAGCGKRFNNEDMRKTVLLERDAGIATYLRDETGFARIHHPVRERVRRAIRTLAREEEKRVLYVALTRARERLYLSASAEKPEQKYEQLRSYLSQKDITKESLAEANSVLTWIFEALAVSGTVGDAVCEIQYPIENPYQHRETKGNTTQALENTVQTMRTADAADAVSGANTERAEDTAMGTAVDSSAGADANIAACSYRGIKKHMEEIFSFVYPDIARTKIPSKLSVSELHKMHEEEKVSEPSKYEHMEAVSVSLTAELDAEAGDEIPDANISTAKQRSYAVPRFLQDPTQDKPTAAQCGTATHAFIQFCDYQALMDETLPRKERIAREIERLQNRHLISEETASRIDRRALAVFLKSKLLAKLGAAAEIRREVRFNLYVPAKKILTDLENAADDDIKVLVQGIIDCYYTDENGRVILIDYKTDHFPRAQLEKTLEVEAILKERHKEQLSYYCEAVEQLLCRPVYDVRIYSFALGYDFSVL